MKIIRLCIIGIRNSEASNALHFFIFQIIFCPFVRSAFLHFPISSFLRFFMFFVCSFLDFKVSKFQSFQVSKIPRFWDSKIPRCQISKITIYLNSKVPKTQSSNVSKFQSFKYIVSKCLEHAISNIFKLSDSQNSRNDICLKRFGNFLYWLKYFYIR